MLFSQAALKCRGWPEPLPKFIYLKNREYEESSVGIHFREDLEARRCFGK
jgi:hypothetical protein